ncbi:MAG: AAA family ATPase [Bacilli bacterium]|nr:AAA family ATPase [Bacilli bacterium]
MYLKEIVTSGFKSFADKLELKLDGKITCIVGPNGSGKSNVVDAVRWVLGEQSVKSLRGDGSMTDVIFSGSKSRNPLNVASVELILDNSDHYLNVPYTDISIKRRVYRSGENEYYLNNERCRLKDITNILLDSGMGRESYNIISQGEVDKILSNSAYERRVIFEEASGILKYKKRKEEALHKLDKTHNNIDRVNDIIGELEIQVEPLRIQSEKAREYLENKKGLDQYEVALLAYDISEINTQLENNKKKKEKIDQELQTLLNKESMYDAKNMEDTSLLEEKEKEVRSLQQELMSVVEERTRIEGERNLLKEKAKTTKEEDQIKEEIRQVLETKEKITSEIKVLEEELQVLENEKKLKEDEINTLNKKIDDHKAHRNILMTDYSKHNQDLIYIKHQINGLETELDQGVDIPNSVRKVLHNTSLNGIYDTIGNLLLCDEKYSKALNTAISSCRNFIITKDEDSAKKAIQYLKDSHLGRATFFPLDVIKERTVDSETLNTLSNYHDYLGIMADLVQYSKEYNSVMRNQLGNVLVVSDIDSATRISHKINARYKIVTLEGDVINVGGSLTGGSTNTTRSAVLVKQELNHLREREQLLKKEEEEIQLELQDSSKKQSDLEGEFFQLSKEDISLQEELEVKKKELLDLKEKQNSYEKEMENLSSIKNHTLDEKEEEMIKLFHEKTTLKEQLEIRIDSVSKEIEHLKRKMEDATAEDKLNAQQKRNLEKESRDIEIFVNRADVKLDQMLTTLAVDYEMTFERAKEEYVLDIDVEEARTKVEKYRANIKRIGMVNVDSIEEFERVNTRYEFLTKQKEDLENAESTLLEIMRDMDEVMKEEFASTFELIREEFKKVFRELFKGGNADLKLTEPDDLLNTGVDIVASPPGKKLTTISLLSGGEKTLTAISLLFAILNVRTVPFCLFDEVEAALDEANVVQFGKYLENYKDKTQFLIITHKKKTMEYANTLYGITMQESGVSKLVSVKLEEHKDFV